VVHRCIMTPGTICGGPSASRGGSCARVHKVLVEVRAEVVCDVNTASPYLWWKANSSIYSAIQYSGNISSVHATRMQLGLASWTRYVATPDMSPRTQGFFMICHLVCQFALHGSSCCGLKLTQTVHSEPLKCFVRDVLSCWLMFFLYGG